MDITKINDATNAWFSLLSHILSSGHNHSPQGKMTKEIIQKTTCIDMSKPIVLEKSRNVSYSFMAAEAAWILQGRNDVKYMSLFAPSMERFSDDGIVYNGAYGPRVTQQLSYAVDCLLKDRDTRQSINCIWTPNPRNSKDIPCTLSLQFLIRNGKLICNANMRSSDAWIGYIYDIFNFTMISTYVALEYNRRVENNEPISLGYLNLTAGSQHLYEQNWADALALITTHHDHIEKYEVDQHCVNNFKSGEELILYLDTVAHGLRLEENFWLSKLIK